MKQKTLRYVLVLAGAAAVSMPLLAEINKSTPPAPSAPNTQQPAKADAADALKGAAPAAAPEVDPSKVIVQVGDEKITAGEFNGIITQLPPEVQAQALSPAGKRRLADRLVQIKLMSTEAKRRKLDESAQVKGEMKIAEDQILAQALARDVQNGGDAQSKEYFEQNKDSFSKVKARHILIGTGATRQGKPPLTDDQAKAKADDVRKRLVAGEDFAKLAKAESDDPGSAATGGEYTFGHGRMVPEFEKAAFSLKKGEISQPVKTQFGYHVIQLQETIAPSYEEAKDEIARRQGPEKLEKLVEDLKNKNKVTMDESFFGKAPEEAKPAAADQSGKPATGTGTTPAATPKTSK